jgi:O-methyltransferase
MGSKPMGSNWITKTVDKIVEDRRRFFWDAFVALEINKISGDYVEFGSYGGNSLSLAYEAISEIGNARHLWAFDSFDSLPEITDPRDERWRNNFGLNQGGVENFYADCDRQGVPRDAYTAVVGYFSDTLPRLGAAGAPADIALVYVDCNMYTSTVSVFEFLAPRLKHGMIIAFDDYFLWTATEVSGERSALDEFLVANPQWHFERYKEVHYAGTSFVVENADLVKTK